MLIKINKIFVFLIILFSIQDLSSQTFDLIPPDSQTRRIYVVDNGSKERQNFIFSLLNTLSDLEREFPDLPTPGVTIIDALPAHEEEYLHSDMPQNLKAAILQSKKLDIAGRTKWAWPWDSRNGWIRNWGLFVLKDLSPFLLRFYNSCDAKIFNNTVKTTDNIKSELCRRLDFQGGNIRVIDSKTMLTGSNDKNGKLAKFFSKNGIKVLNLNTEWMDQKDIDNLLTPIPNSEGIYIAYASPDKAIELLNSIDEYSTISFHDPERKGKYAMRTLKMRQFAESYNPSDYILALPIKDFLLRFGEYNNKLNVLIENEISKISNSLGIPRERFIPIPALWGQTGRKTGAEILPNPANAMILTLGNNSTDTFPKIFILTGDTRIPVFNSYIEETLKPLGKTYFLDTWDLSSEYGNVNCSTNELRY